jgi:8-oxo-dGTP pyrophosphatase MutT (NUDIX family)
MRKISKRVMADKKPLWTGEYLSVYLLDDFYETLHDGTGKFVAVLGYRRVGRDAWEYLGRVEKCPPHQDGFALCALTGGIEKDEEPLQAAIRELKEESGITSDKLKPLGTIRPSKMSDSTGWLFAVDLTDEPDQDKYAGKGDGSKGEEGAYCKFISYKDGISSKDPILATMIARLGFNC